MKRKMLSLLLAGVMLAGCLSGCGDKSQESKEQESSKNSEVKVSSEAESGTQQAAELEEKTIQVWLLGPGKQKDSEKVWEAFNEKLQEYVPNTTVEFTVTPSSEYNTKFTQLLAAEEAVDLAWVGYASGNMDQHIADGDLMELDELAAEYGQGILDSLGERVLNMNRYDGKLYYLISWQGLVDKKRAIYVPTEYVEMAGDGWLEETEKAVDAWWNTPVTVENVNKVFDQFDILLSAAKENGKLYSGVDMYYFFGYEYNFNYAKETGSVGVERFDDTFTVKDLLTTDYTKAVWARKAEFYEKGYIRSDIASLQLGSGGDLSFVTNGQYNSNTVMLKMGSFLVDSAVDTESAKAGVEITAIPIEDNGWLTSGNATAMAIPYCADEPERAMMVLNALYTEPELYQLLVYGIEGTHYTKNADGTITTPYGGSASADSDYGLRKWTQGTCKNALDTQDDVPGYYAELEEKEATAYVDPLAGFVFDGSAVEDVIAALSAVDTEYTNRLNYGYEGENWEEVYNKFMSERQKAGVDKLIEEYQRQLDEYIKANNITSWRQ